MFHSLEIPNPQRNRRFRTSWESFFPYHAGYSEAFARTVLSSARLRPNAMVLDPWNGSGTTTYVASELGLSSMGFDLNPIMIIVARARLLPPSEVDSIDPIARDIVMSAARARTELDDQDPLCLWFDRKTARSVRIIERTITRRLLGSRTLTQGGPELDRMSGLAASAYVALFAICRSLVSRFRSSNPTWLRLPKVGMTKVRVKPEMVQTSFVQTLANMSNALASQATRIVPEGSMADLRLMDTTNAFWQADSADFILTSPPYCTRIDYTAATRIELAVMAPLTGWAPNDLGRRMLGSTRVPLQLSKESADWGQRCVCFLRALRTHPSSASSGYYYKTHLDYFSKLFNALKHIEAVLRPRGSAILVVRDSYYKDVHNDLPAIVSEMAGARGLKLRRRDDFRLQHTLADINPRSRKYRSTTGALEAVLCFQKQ